MHVARSIDARRNARFADSHIHLVQARRKICPGLPFNPLPVIVVRTHPHNGTLGLGLGR